MTAAFCCRSTSDNRGAVPLALVLAAVLRLTGVTALSWILCHKRLMYVKLVR